MVPKEGRLAWYWSSTRGEYKPKAPRSSKQWLSVDSVWRGSILAEIKATSVQICFLAWSFAFCR